MTHSVEQNRKQKILDAAEHAISECGFTGASLRHITAEAKVNLATVYYYFGSKEGLFKEVFLRRLSPLRQMQLDRLKALESQPEKPTLAQLIESILSPVKYNGENKQIALKLVGRINTEPHPLAQELIKKNYGTVRLAYTKAFQKILPGLSLKDIQWRLEFVWGAMIFVLCNPGRVSSMTEGLCDTSNAEEMIQQMTRFFEAGLQSPAVVSTDYKTGNV